MECFLRLRCRSHLWNELNEDVQVWWKENTAQQRRTKSTSGKYENQSAQADVASFLKGAASRVNRLKNLA